MLYDYSIREEDREDIKTAIGIQLREACVAHYDQILEKLLIQLLWRKVMFGFYSTHELYMLLLKGEVAETKNPIRFGATTPVAVKNSFTESYISCYRDFYAISPAGNPVESDETKVLNIRKRVQQVIHGIDTALGQELIGRVIYQDIGYYELKGLSGKSLELLHGVTAMVQPVELFIKSESSIPKTYGVLHGMDNLKNIADYPYQCQVNSVSVR